MNIYLDIETIPNQSPGLLDEYRANVKAPGTYKKPESIAKWIEENAEAAADKEWRKTALSGSSGEIVCIGVAVNDEPVSVFKRNPCDSERELLGKFGDYLEQHLPGVEKARAYVIGHNVLSFDLRFIYQRSVILQTKLPVALPWGDRKGGNDHYDTMYQWAGWGEYISQDNLAKALGLAGKPSDISGATVWDEVAKGNIDRVAEYCKDDVEQNREIYKRMTFQH